MTDLAVVSVVIPAYDRPDLLERCLDSLLNQTYRPLQIIVGDDHSPTPLAPTVMRYVESKNRGTEWVFVRNSSNLGTYSNLVNLLLTKATGKYLLIAPHDDWWIDTCFISNCVSELQRNPDIHVAISNSLVETSAEIPVLMMNCYSINNSWTYLDGSDFVRNELFTRLHPAYSAVIMDFQFLQHRDFPNFLLELEGVASSLHLETDEGFSGIILAASGHRIAFSSSVVSVRGDPPDSWSKSLYWQKYGTSGVFINYALLTERFFPGSDDKDRLTLLNMMRVYWPQVFSFRTALWLYRLNGKFAEIYVIGFLRYEVITLARKVMRLMRFS